MIRYEITSDDLNTMIRKAKSSWLARAKKCTDKCRSKKAYVDQGNIWTEIKKVYLQIQHHKCIYCERKLASTISVFNGKRLAGGPGSIEHDVEHFRPKSKISKWPSERIESSRGIKYGFALGGMSSKGYYLLAFHPLNYGTSCKTCNTPLKSDFFPIEGTRKISKDSPSLLNSELPLLIYPISTLDADPQEIITFDGYLIRPVKKSGRSYRRAIVTIDFFELDTREELLRERAERIVTMFFAQKRLRTANQQSLAKKLLDSYIEAGSPHASCCRAYRSLLQSKPARAKAIADKAMAYLTSQS